MSQKTDKTLRALENAGLTSKEAQVYRALLQLGQVGASRIAKETGLHGQFVYDSVRTLEEKGLVQYVTMRGRRKYSAKSPRHLSALVEKKKKELDSVIEELEAQAVVSPENQFEVFQGVESFTAKEMGLLKAMPKDGSVLIIGGEGDQYAEKSGKMIHEFDYTRMKKNIRVRYIGAQTQQKNLEQESERRLFSYRLLPGEFKGSTNYAVYKEIGVFGLYVFSDPVTSFIVHNKKIARDFETFFETLWTMGK